MLSVANPRSNQRIQGSVASDDQATQAWLTEAEQVPEHQEVAVDRLTKHCMTLDSLRKGLDGQCHSWKQIRLRRSTHESSWKHC